MTETILLGFILLAFLVFSVGAALYQISTLKEQVKDLELCRQFLMQDTAKMLVRIDALERKWKSND